MSEPTQNKEEMSGGSKSNAEIHDSTGKVLGIVGFGIACLALGIALMLPLIMDAKIETIKATLSISSDKATVAENHWRNIEVKQGVMENKLEELSHANRK